MSESFVFSLINMNNVLACSRRAILSPLKKLTTSFYCTCFNTTTLLFPEETMVYKEQYLLIQFEGIEGNRFDGVAEILIDTKGYLRSQRVEDLSGIRVLKRFDLERAPEDSSLPYDQPIYIVRKSLGVYRDDQDSLVSRNHYKMKLGDSIMEYETFIVPFKKDTLVSDQPFLLVEDVDFDS